MYLIMVPNSVKGLISASETGDTDVWPCVVANG